MYLSHNIVTALIKAEKNALTIKLRLKPEDLPDGISLVRDSKTLFFLINNLGLKITLKDAQAIVKGDAFDSQDLRTKVVENSRAAMSFVRTQWQNGKIQFNDSLLLRINMILGLGVGEDWQLKYREAGERFAIIYDDLADLAGGDAKELNAASRTQIIIDEFTQAEQPELYRISMLLFNLLKLHPFMILNKYSICLIGELLLGRYLRGQEEFFNLMEFFTQKTETIKRAFSLSDMPAQEVAWHELFISSLAEQLLESGQKLLINSNSASDRPAKQGSKPFLDLNKRQLKILKYLQSIPTVKREDYVEMMSISAMTAYRDLQELVDNKILKIKGVGRGTKYMLYSR